MQQETKTSTNGVALWAWRIAGFVSLALGVLGILLPLLPTTPFLLLSAFCFGRGSERLLQWLLQHPRLGPPIRDWREHRSISERAKVLAIVALILVVVLTYILDAPGFVLIAQIIVAALVGAFILTRPSSS